MLTSGLIDNEHQQPNKYIRLVNNTESRARTPRADMNHGHSLLEVLAGEIRSRTPSRLNWMRRIRCHAPVIPSQRLVFAPIQVERTTRRIDTLQQSHIAARSRNAVTLLKDSSSLGI